MKGRVVFLISSIIGLLCLVAYIINVNPQFVQLLNLKQFDREELRKQVNEVSSNFLDKKKEYKKRESIYTAGEAAKVLEKIFELKAELKIANDKIPNTFLETQFFEPDSLSKIENVAPYLIIAIDTNSKVSYLEIKSKNDRKSQNRRIYEIGEVIGLNFNKMSRMESSKNDTFEVSQRAKERTIITEEKANVIIFYENIEGVPLTSYAHKWTIDEEGIKYERALALKKQLKPVDSSQLEDILSFFFWFILGFFAFLTLIFKIRRDELDYNLLLWLGILISLISLISFSLTITFNFFLIILFLILSTVIGFFLSLIFAVAESKTRDNFDRHLKVLDAIVSMNINVKENGRLVLRSFFFGNLFFIVPLFYIFMEQLKQKKNIVVFPPHCIDVSSTFPLSFLFNNLISSLMFPYFCIILFGIFAPSLLARKNNLIFQSILSLFFASLSSIPLGYKPLYISFLVFFFISFVLLQFWNREGFIGTFLAMFFPLSIQRGLLLIFAKDAQIAIEGASLLVLIILFLIVACYWSVKGREIDRITPYEPLYLRKIKEKERFERELEIAKSLQQRLLPKNPPNLEKIEIATFCEPANEVGGDYYDFIDLGQRKILSFLGDVSGKGIKAAFYMTLAKGLLHGSFGLVKDHKELLKLLNQRFGSLCEEGIFLTLITLTIDRDSCDVIVTSAGHNPPLLCKGGKSEYLPVKGLVIGPLPEEMVMNSLIEYQFKIEKNDVLLLYTDGVTESFDHKFEEYGTERLEEVVLSCCHKSPKEIIDEIRKSVSKFTGGAPLRDDFTMVVLKGRDV